jgi:hypothetical protein
MLQRDGKHTSPQAHPEATVVVYARFSIVGISDLSLSRSVDRNTRRKAPGSGACFIPRRSGYLGKIARSNAVLSTTLKFALMGRLAIYAVREDCEIVINTVACTFGVR